jgi:hypothetical protein
MSKRPSTHLKALWEPRQAPCASRACVRCGRHWSLVTGYWTAALAQGYPAKRAKDAAAARPRIFRGRVSPPARPPSSPAAPAPTTSTRCCLAAAGRVCAWPIS